MSHTYSPPKNGGNASVPTTRQIPFFSHCYYAFAEATFNGGERVVGRVASSLIINFYVMSKDQFDQFDGALCASEYEAYVSARGVRSYSFDWIVPAGGDYYFIFDNYAGNAPTQSVSGTFSFQMPQTITSTSTVSSGYSNVYESTASYYVLNTVNPPQPAFSQSDAYWLFLVLIAAALISATWFTRRPKKAK